MVEAQVAVPGAAAAHGLGIAVPLGEDGVGDDEDGEDEEGVLFPP
jgi:hypothetical protein